MDANRTHALLSDILEGMPSEDQQKALVAFSSMAQGDPNSLPVQLALFVKGATNSMQNAGDVVKTAPSLIEGSFARGLKNQEDLQRGLTDGLEKFLPQVEKINKGMATVPTSIETIVKYAEATEKHAQKVKSTLSRFVSFWLLASVVLVVIGISIDEGFRRYILPPITALSYSGQVRLSEVTKDGATGKDTKSGQTIYLNNFDAGQLKPGAIYTFKNNQIVGLQIIP